MNTYWNRNIYKNTNENTDKYIEKNYIIKHT